MLCFLSVVCRRMIGMCPRYSPKHVFFAAFKTSFSILRCDKNSGIGLYIYKIPFLLPLQMNRQRSNSEPNSPELKRNARTPDVVLEPTKPLRHAYSELSPIHSPTSPTTEDHPSDIKAATFSRKFTSSIRRRLSSKGKAGQRFSASDVLDDRSSRSPPNEVEYVKSAFPGTLNRVEHGGKMKKGFLRKIARSNSLRRRSDSNLNKMTVKKTDMDGSSASHEG